MSLTLVDLPDGSLPMWTPLQVTVATNRIPKGYSVSAAMRFVVSGSGSWQIDDVYVDPYRAG
jgi:hypothetical protein